MIDYYKRNSKKVLDKLDRFAKHCWINVVDPGEEEIKFLVEEFKLDKELVLDGLDIYEIPRVEEEDGKFYFYLRIPTFKIENEYTGSFLIIVSKNYFMTVSDKRLELFDRCFKTKKDFFNNNPLKAFLEVLSILSHKYNFWIRSISKDVKKNRRNIKNLDERDITELVLNEDILNDYLSSLNPLIHLYNRMLRLKSLNLRENEKEFIEDLLVDLNQIFNSCVSSLKTITNMRDYYTTTLSNSRNNILRVLTIFTVFLTVPMVLSGIYGMNIDLPLQTHHTIFWVLSLLVIIIWAAAYFVFRRNRII